LRAAPVVSVTGLTKRYGQLTAIDGLSFSLEQGTVTGFLGPNGAGKTTTLRLLLGLAEPTAGEALVFGDPYRELEHPACPKRTPERKGVTAIPGTPPINHETLKSWERSGGHVALTRCAP
jgi:ABC-type multidrug transport system ATPase subunit